MIALVLGALFAVITIAMVKDLSLPPRFFALAMVGLPIVYMGLAALAGDMQAIGLELLYGLPFLLVGVVCFRRGFKASGILVTAMWAAHAAYDVYHNMLVANAGVPGWYPALCLGFDLVIVVYLFFLVRWLPNYDISASQTPRR